MNEWELRIHNERVDERRLQEAREHGFSSWGEYIDAREEGIHPPASGCPRCERW